MSIDKFNAYLQQLEPLIRPHLAAVQASVKKQLANAKGKSKEVIQNDEQFSGILETAYDALPFMVRLAVKKEKFIAFCMHNRDLFIPREEIRPNPDDKNKLEG